jgi:hypothetical protein
MPSCANPKQRFSQAGYNSRAKILDEGYGELLQSRYRRLMIKKGFLKKLPPGFLTLPAYRIALRNIPSAMRNSCAHDSIVKGEATKKSHF